MLGRELPLRLARHPGPRRRRLSDRRGVGRRHVRRHQASGHRGPCLDAVGRRAARVRDGRSARVHHARRDRGLHDDPAGGGRRRPRAGLRDRGPAGDGRVSRSPSPTGRDTKPSARWCTRGRMRSTRRSSRIACCASGSTAWGCASIGSSRSSSARAPRTVRWRDRRRKTCRRCSFAIGVRGNEPRRRRAIHPRDRTARAQRTAECDGLRRRPPEGRGGRRVLARADRQAGRPTVRDFPVRRDS